ncbi:hypothetical protein ACF08B_03890 [Streptomyces sp. NPDC015139]|uniref:hypothetical protein n=1 Tax=Streptomyces sp. NPDC015139 TaxID=3364942 RepID=UPI0036F5C7C3
MSVRSRKSLLTAVALTVGLSLAAVTPALAGAGANRTARAGAVSTAQGDPRDVTQHVADFYAADVDSARATDDPSAATGTKALRGFYLSSAARAKVAAYEKRQHTLTWSDGPHARVTGIDVLSDLKTLEITDLKPVR